MRVRNDQELKMMRKIGLTTVTIFVLPPVFLCLTSFFVNRRTIIAYGLSYHF